MVPRHRALRPVPPAGVSARCQVRIGQDALDSQNVYATVNRWRNWMARQAIRESDGVALDQAASDSSTIAQ
jgi:hypothetical protein